MKALIRTFVKLNKAGMITSEFAYIAPCDMLQKGFYAFQSTASELHLCWLHTERPCGSHTQISQQIWYPSAVSPASKLKQQHKSFPIISFA